LQPIFARSSNGRTTDFGSVCVGSNPARATWFFLNQIIAPKVTSIINQVKLFSGTGSNSLAEKIAKEYGKELGNVTIAKFSDGEIQPSFDESVRGCDVFIIQSTNSPSDNLMELLLMIDASRRASSNYITAVIPYFGYARQDRKDKPRVSIGSKMIADILSASGANRVITMDLHAPQIQGFFNIPVDHLDASVIFIPYIASLQLENLAIGAPDVGATARNREYSRTLDCPLIICDKQRKKANEIAAMQVIGDVENMDIVLVDDLVDTAGTLAKAAALLMDKGASSVRAVCTHPVLSGKAYENIENSVLTELVVCDTIPLQKHDCSKIKVLSTASLFSKAIRQIHEHGSISSLFKMEKVYQKSLI
jgi:ribose-phosphate pyrophosphokinase